MLKLKPLSKRKFSYDNTIKKGLDKFDSLYEKLIRFVLRYKKTSMIAALLIFASTMMLLPQIGSEFIPQTDQGQLSTVVELQTGIRVEETSKIARQIEGIINERYKDEIAMLNVSSGADDAGGISSLFGSSGSNIINIRLRLLKAKQRDRSCWDIAADFREQLTKIPEIIDFNISFSGGNMMGGDNDIKTEIYGYDFNTTGALAAEIAEKIKGLEGAVNVKISRDKLKPELEFVLDPEKMSLYGLNTASVATALRNRVRGMTATQFREEGEEYEVIVRLSEEYRNTISAIENIVVTNPQGLKVRLFDIGEIKESYLPPNIDHKRRERIVSVSATPEGVSLGQLAKEIQKVVDNTEIPSGVIVQIGGAYENQQDSFADLGLLMLVALILVYIVMASQFESFKMPVIIMVSIPFSFSGVVLGLWLTNTNLSIIAALGAVLLIGIVVKNAILLIDYTNLMRDRGYALYEALALSGKSRLRPVLMTALTSIFGMLPLALSTGEGAEIWKPMGISVIGGLTFSTFLTLVIVPVIYAVLDKTGSRSKKRLAYRKEFSFME
jgi:HAE1 family hydrophobic/amphiphilic exporter-1